MNSIFMKKTTIGATKEQLFEMLKVSMLDNGVDINEQQMNRVYQLACRAYSGLKRYSGEEYVTHALNVSIILSEMGQKLK